MKINIINDLDSYSEILKKYNLVKKDLNFIKHSNLYQIILIIIKVNYIFI